MTGEVEIVILRTIRTKKGKSMLQYGIKSDTTQYSKGLSVSECWYEDERAYNISEEHILKPLKAQAKFELGFNGTSHMVITSIYDKNGVVVMA